MAKVPDGKTNNTLKGPYKSVKFVVFGEENGIPFRRTYRTQRGVNGLKATPGIKVLSIESAH